MGQGEKKGHRGWMWGVKAGALVLLVLQNSSASLLMRQSQRTGAGDWVPQTGVIAQEVVKGLLSLVLVMLTGESPWTIVSRPRELLRTSVPALLYLLQNNLQYVAVGYLDAATYTVTYQLKILSTALMSVLLLRRSLDSSKWVALLVLVVGVAMVQLSVMAPPPTSSARTNGTSASEQLLGLTAVLSACVISGLAGVYLEMMLKDSPVSLWVRNTQLAGYSILIGMCGLAFTDDLGKVQQHGFFHGYNSWTLAAVMNNGFGGLLIAVVIKYADNILKNFATSLSIILTTAVSMTLLGLEVGTVFLSGICLVCYSTFLYGGVVRFPSFGDFYYKTSPKLTR